VRYHAGVRGDRMDVLGGLARAVVSLGFITLFFALILAVLQLFSIARSLRRIADVAEGRRFDGRFFAREEVSR
jgi:hypothetical protein